MKNKLLRPLIITAALLIVFIGGYLMLEKFSPEPEASPTATPVGSIISSTATLTRVHAQPTDDAAFDVTVVNTGDEPSYTVIPAFPGYTYNLNKLRALTNSFTQLQAQALIKENATAQELSEYGFDKPLARFTGEYSDQSKIELILGAQTVTQDAYYAKRADSATVYTISKLDATALLVNERSLRALPMFPASEDANDPNGHVNKVALTKADGSVVTLRRLTEEEAKKIGELAATYEVSFAGTYEANETNADEKFISPILSIALMSVVEDNPKDLSKYGLDKPAKIELTHKSGDVYTLLIGSTDADGNRYVMKPGIDSVLLAGGNSFTFLDVSRTSLISPLVWLYDVDEVSAVTFDLDGTKHTLSIDSDSDNDKFDASLDGKDITRENASRLYQRVLSVYIAGELADGQKYGDPKYTITMTFRDGTSRVLKLCPINDRQFAVLFDGRAEFFANIKDIETIISAFDIIKRGEELPWG